MRRILSGWIGIMLCMTLIVGFVCPQRVEAAETYSITVNNSEAGHAYTAYQIFTGDLYEKTETVGGNSVTTKILSNVEKGSGLSSTSALVTALKSNSTLQNKNGIKDLTSTSSAADIAKALETANLTSDESVALGKVVNSCKTGDGTPLTQSNNVYTTSGFAPGYYLITDGKADGEATPSNYSSLLLEVVDNQNIEPKTGAPQIVKKVWDYDYSNNNDSITIGGNTINAGEGYNDVTDAAINDYIEYEIFMTLPDNFDSYDHYYMRMEDNMDESLELFGVSDVDVNVYMDVDGKFWHTITFGDADYFSVQMLNPNNPYATWADVPVSAYSSYQTDKQNLMVLFNDVKSISGVTKDTIFRIHYYAVLNDKAKLGNPEGNKNRAKIVYSNDPQNPGDGESEPNSTGETPVDTNVVFTYGIDTTKVSSEKDAEGHDVNLSGATFALYSYLSDYGENGDEKSYGYGKYYMVFAADQDGALKDSNGAIWPEYYDAYDTDTPTADAKPKKYSDVNNSAGYGIHTFTTDANGKIVIKGLNAGTYFLEEIKAPDGYNLLTEPIKIVITPTVVNTQNYLNTTTTSKSNDSLKSQNSQVLTGLTGSVYPKKNSSGAFVEDTTIATLDTENTTVAGGKVVLTIKNQPGSVLPSTGGRGTTIFYIIGLGLIATAGIGIVMKRRSRVA